MPHYTAAAIDPGGSTGLVIADVRIDGRVFTLHPLALATLRSPKDVLYYIEQAKPVLIYLERRAGNPSSPEGLLPYEAIYNGLESFGYAMKRSDPPAQRQVVLLNPAFWKPFMKIAEVDLASWKPQTLHETDAMHILYFGILVNNPGKKVVYG